MHTPKRSIGATPTRKTKTMPDNNDEHFGPIITGFDGDGAYRFVRMGRDGNPIFRKDFSRMNYPPNLDELQIDSDLPPLSDDDDLIDTGLSLEAIYCHDCDDDGVFPKRRIVIECSDCTEWKRTGGKVSQRRTYVTITRPEEAEAMAKWMTAAAKWMKDKKDTDWVALRDEIEDKRIREILKND